MCGLMDSRTRPVDVRAEQTRRERERFMTALYLIASGYISPSIGFAQDVLAGDDPHEALHARVRRSRS